MKFNEDDILYRSYNGNVTYFMVFDKSATDYSLCVLRSSSGLLKEGVFMLAPIDHIDDNCRKIDITYWFSSSIFN